MMEDSIIPPMDILPSFQRLLNIYNSQYILMQKKRHIYQSMIETIDQRFEKSLKLHFKAWKNTVYSFKVIEMMKSLRTRRMKQKVFEIFQFNYWQAAQFRNIQKKGKIVTPYIKVFRAWVKYTKWCQRFNHCFERSVIRIKSTWLKNWIKLKNNCFKTRQFRRNLDLIRLREAMKCLKRNIILNKYLIKYQMKTRSELLFFHKFIRKSLFQRWCKVMTLHKAFDLLEDKFTYRNLSYAFNELKQHSKITFPQIIMNISKQTVRASQKIGTESMKFRKILTSGKSDENSALLLDSSPKTLIPNTNLTRHMSSIQETSNEHEEPVDDEIGTKDETLKEVNEFQSHTVLPDISNKLNSRSLPLTKMFRTASGIISTSKLDQ